MTGDLGIVGKNKLRKLFTKSFKYRETNNILWGKVKFTITEWLDDGIGTCFRKTTH